MMAGPASARPLIRRCRDLNVWVDDFPGTWQGRRGGSGPWPAAAVHNATSPAGRLQLVVSLGMLDCLALVLVRDFDVDPAAVDALMRAIAAIVALGPDHNSFVITNEIAE